MEEGVAEDVSEKEPTTLSREDKKRLKSFRFGVPLDKLPCTYLPDCGNVATFLVEAGEIIRQHVDVEGLFRKSADLSHQDELKLQAERGEGLQEDLDVHEVTGLVKTFFRLLPEPLLPCLFHDPFLCSMELPSDASGGQRREAIQELCFALPAPHLSCLRYFMNLLAHIAHHVDKNRMNARNLAVVLTPSLIRLKVRTKLMSPEELRVLPKQTALIEHLVCHADGIGCMTPKLYQHSVQMTEELLRRKLRPKKKKGRLRTNLEERLQAVQTVLNVVASLHFRPYTSATVSDTVLVDGPHRHAVTSSSHLQNPSINSESQYASYINSMAENRNMAPLKGSPIKRCGERHKSRSKKRRRTINRRSRTPMGKSDCKSMSDPLIQSWSAAIPVISFGSKSDSDSESFSDDSCWSDESADQSESDEKISQAVDEILKEHPFLAVSTDSPFNTENSSFNTENSSSDEHPSLLATDSSFNTEKSSSGSCETVIMFPNSPTNFEEIQEKSKEEQDLASCELAYSDEVASSDIHNTSFKSIHRSGDRLVPEDRTDCHSVSEDMTSSIRKEENTCQTVTETNACFVSSEKSSKVKNIGMVLEVFNQSVHPFEEPVRKLNRCSESLDANSETNKSSESVDANNETFNQCSQIVDAQQLSFASKLLSASLQHNAFLNSPMEAVSAGPPTQPAGRLKKHLLQLAQRYNAMEEQQTSETTHNTNIVRQNWMENQVSMLEKIASDENDCLSLSKTKSDLAVSESRRSMSVQHMTNQCKDSFPKTPSVHLNSSPNQPKRFNCSVENPDQLQQLQQKSDYLEVSQRQASSYSTETMPPHHTDCLRHQRLIDPNGAVTSRMQRSPINHSKASVRNIPESGCLPQWRLHKMKQLQSNRFHFNHCTMNSPGLGNISHQHFLSKRFYESSQKGSLSQHCLRNYCKDMKWYKGYSPRGRCSQSMDQYFPQTNDGLAHCSSFCRFSCGFGSMQPTEIHHHETNLLSEYAFVQERNNYIANFLHNQQRMHLPTAVPKELSEEEKNPCLETSSFPNRVMYPSLNSHAMVQKKSFETFCTQGKVIQTQSMKYSEDDGSTSTLYKNSGTCGCSTEKEALLYREMSLPELSCQNDLVYREASLEELPCQMAYSGTWINEESRNKWLFQAENNARRQLSNPSVRHQEFSENEKERRCNSFHGYPTINQLSDEPHQYSYQTPQMQEQTQMKYALDNSHVNLDACSTYNLDVLFPGSSNYFNLTPLNSQHSDLQSVPHNPFISDVSFAAKTIHAFEKVNDSKNRENYNQMEQDCKQAHSGFKVNADGKVGLNNNESQISANEDQNELIENQEAHSNPQQTSHEEADKTQQDIVDQTISPQYLGDGQQSIPPESTMVTDSHSPRRRLRKTPGSTSS